MYADEDEVQAKIRRQADELRSEGLDVTLWMQTVGAPGAAQMIADAARDFRADVIVVGTRGHTAIGGLLLGSVTQRLLQGALGALRRCRVADDAVDVAWAPGAFDLPVVAQALARSGRYDAVVCLGCVIRGETTHDRYVALGATTGLLQVSLESSLPVTFGVLTTQTLEQAEARSGGPHGNKGEDAALAAVELVNLLRRIRASPRG